MLNEYIIFIMLTIFAVEDMKKGRIHILPLFGFLVSGIFYLILARPVSGMEAAGGAAVGFLLLFVSRVTGEALGYGDGWVFFITGLYLGFWENVQLLFVSLTLSSIFSAIYILRRKINIKKEIPFLPFVWGAEIIHLGGMWYEKMV